MIWDEDVRSIGRKLTRESIVNRVIAIAFRSVNHRQTCLRSIDLLYNYPYCIQNKGRCLKIGLRARNQRPLARLAQLGISCRKEQPILGKLVPLQYNSLSINGKWRRSRRRNPKPHHQSNASCQHKNKEPVPFVYRTYARHTHFTRSTKLHLSISFAHQILGLL